MLVFQRRGARRFVTTWLLLGFAACSRAYPPPPDTPTGNVVDTLHGQIIPDPYRWLEDQNSPQTREWIDAQNSYAATIIGETPLRDEIREQVRRLSNTVDIGSPRRAGDWEYFTLRRADQELPVIYRRSAPPKGERQRIDPSMDYQVVLDPHAMSPDHTTRVDIEAISEDGRLMIYSVRDGGQDEVEINVRDVETGEDLPDHLPRALYSSIAFDQSGTGFYYSRRSRQTGARIRHHTFGTALEDDPVLFGEGYGPTSFVSMSQEEDGRFFVYTVQHGWRTNEIHIQDNRTGGGIRPVVTGLDALSYPRLTNGTLYLRTNYQAPNYRVVAVDLAHPEPERWRDVIPEADDVLQDYTEIDGKYYATYLHDVSTEIRIFEKDGTPAGSMDIPAYHTASVRGAGDGKAMLTLSSFTLPTTTYLVDLATGEREVWESPSNDYDSTGVVVEQVWRESPDGTRAPMYVMHRSDVSLDGNNPTLLTGYGGFNVSLTPRFDLMGAAMVERGGVFALATLRGGSEFGETWHRDGMLENKQHVFDDFISAAEWLIDNGYTNPKRLGIRGGSNGGLLVGSAFTQRPDLFRAVLCGFPDLDLVRFWTFTETNNMPALLEYGNASDPEQFAFVRLYSPYQNVRERTEYPAIMFSTGDLDTRVPPLQARKMTARVQAATTSGLPVILHYEPKAGHAAGRGRPESRAIEDTAMELTFLMSQLGMETGTK
jgi:prolyl oligopeptidase